MLYVDSRMCLRKQKSACTKTICEGAFNIHFYMNFSYIYDTNFTNGTSYNFFGSLVSGILIYSSKLPPFRAHQVIMFSQLNGLCGFSLEAI